MTVYVVQVAAEHRPRIGRAGFEFGWRTYTADTWADAWAQVRADEFPKKITPDDLVMGVAPTATRPPASWHPEHNPPPGERTEP